MDVGGRAWATKEHHGARPHAAALTRWTFPSRRLVRWIRRSRRAAPAARRARRSRRALPLRIGSWAHVALDGRNGCPQPACLIRQVGRRGGKAITERGRYRGVALGSAHDSRAVDLKQRVTKRNEHIGYMQAGLFVVEIWRVATPSTAHPSCLCFLVLPVLRAQPSRSA